MRRAGEVLIEVDAQVLQNRARSDLSITEPGPRAQRAYRLRYAATARPEMEKAVLSRLELGGMPRLPAFRQGVYPLEPAAVHQGRFAPHQYADIIDIACDHRPARESRVYLIDQISGERGALGKACVHLVPAHGALGSTSVVQRSLRKLAIQLTTSRRARPRAPAPAIDGWHALTSGRAGPRRDSPGGARRLPPVAEREAGIEEEHQVRPDNREGLLDCRVRYAIQARRLKGCRALHRACDLLLSHHGHPDRLRVVMAGCVASGGGGNRVSRSAAAFSYLTVPDDGVKVVAPLSGAEPSELASRNHLYSAWPSCGSAALAFQLVNGVSVRLHIGFVARTGPSACPIDLRAQDYQHVRVAGPGELADASLRVGGIRGVMYSAYQVFHSLVSLVWVVQGTEWHGHRC
ncbi:hypothetical protein GB937_010567 [Aspergillus fischeri]|nr:hypothetical protein GB937_010567 [Aspergillus fischeri]